MTLLARWVDGRAAVLALAVMLASQVSLAQKKRSGAARRPAVQKSAQKKQARPKVVVLDLEGDKRGRVRAQLEAALRKSGEVTLVPSRQYTAAAARERLKGAAAREPSALARVAPRLGLDAAITGSVGRGLQVRVFDEAGQEVLSRQLSLKRGKVSPSEVGQLARDVASASRPPEVAAFTEPSAPPAEAPAAPPPAAAPPPEPVAAAPVETPAPEAPQAEAWKPRELPPAGESTAQAPKPEAPQPEPASEDASDEVEEGREHPPRVRLYVGGTTTWRRFCARPGVSSCAAFDARPPEERLGDTLSFDTSVPYLGGEVELEVLPLARTGSLLRGLGLVLGAQRGASRTTVRISSPSGATPTVQLVAADTALSALGTFRYYFPRGARPLFGYVGVRGGLMGRAFALDDGTPGPLASTHRLYPVAGLEASLPLLRALRVEGAGHFFFNPQPGQWLTDPGDLSLEVRDFGESVSSFGWSAQLGLAGELWGPLGYSVRARRTQYQDTFSGAGTRTGWSAGGVAEETYHGIHWGLTASW